VTEQQAHVLPLWGVCEITNRDGTVQITSSLVVIAAVELATESFVTFVPIGHEMYRREKYPNWHSVIGESRTFPPGDDPIVDAVEAGLVTLVRLPDGRVCATRRLAA